MVNVEKNGIHTGEKYRFTVLSEGLIRLEYSATGEFNDNKTLLVNNREFQKFDYNVEENDIDLVIETKLFKVNYKKNMPFIDRKKLIGKNLTITNLITKKNWYYKHLEAKNLLGGSFSLDDFSKRTNMDRGLFSLDGFASMDDSFNFVLKNGMLEKNPDGYVDIYIFMYGKDFNPALKDYYTLTGSNFLLRRSMLGLIWNKDMAYDDNHLIKLIEKFKRYDIPISNIILSNKCFENYDFKDKLSFNNDIIKYPDDVLEYVKSQNVTLGATINTDVQIENDKTAFFNEYYDENIKPLVDSGVEIFLNDGTNKENLQLYNSIHYQKGIDDKLRSTLFSRNYKNSIHGNSIIYSGQTISSWDTLKFLPYYNIALANNGISYVSHDIGGFKDGFEDDQLYLRYVQFGVFSSIFRLSSMENKYYKRAPFEWDVKTYNIAKNYIKLRYKMIPYLYSECFNSIKNYCPLIRPLINTNSNLYFNNNYKNEYYLGKHLLISPIVTKKDTLINSVPHYFYLPNGVWYNFQNGKKYKGNKKHISFYTEDDYPVFCKAGTIIPLSNDKGYNNTYNPQSLEICVFPGQNNSYQLYEDNGKNYDYLNWMVHLTNFDYDYFESNFSLTVSIPYKYPGIVGNKRDYKFRFKNVIDASDIKVTLDNNDLYFVSFVEDNDLIIMLDDIKIGDKLVIEVAANEVESIKVIDTEIDDILNGLIINTKLKIKLNEIIFSKEEVKNKRIKIRKLEKEGLSRPLIDVLLKLLEIRENL